MGFKINLYAFEGPLDLLCHLVRKEEVNIYNIPIARITDEYMEYISKWKEMDIEVASEFLVMAAKLMEIKAKTLLPSSPHQSKESEHKEEEKDPREELFEKLVEYRFYKNIAENLAEKETERMKLYTRTLSTGVNENAGENLEEYFDNLNVINLMESFNNVFERKKRKESVEKELDYIKNQTITVTVKEKRELLLNSLTRSKNNELKFRDVVNKTSNSLQDLVVSFLALLELIKEGYVRVYQEGVFAPIWIKTDFF